MASTYGSLPAGTQFKIFVQPIETVAYPNNRNSYVTKEFSHINQEGRKKHLCDMLVILCDCSAIILLGLGANGSYEFLMTFNPATQDTPSHEILPDPRCEGMQSAILIQKHCSHSFDGLQHLK